MGEHITTIGETIAESLRKTAGDVAYWGLDERGLQKDLVARLLRNGAAEIEGLQNEARFRSHVIDEQKAEIERLRAREAELVEALERIAGSVYSEIEDHDHQVVVETMTIEEAAALADTALTAARQEPS